ncbi:SLC13 family permease [Rhodobacteraceae bacterium NNCM2]|nr:SLC13 family permease [Coraliihabitans acroporae]
MTTEIMMLFAIFGSVFILLIWGRFRYDLVAFGALVLACVLNLVPVEHMFSGFGHGAVAIIALVLILSRGLINSGAIEWTAGKLLTDDRCTSRHIGIMASFSAGLSAVINNVAALALLMPLDIEAARRAKRAVGLSLMPLSFASILGGMITLIGTPPNIVISQYREDNLGAPFSMFDFAPVGLSVAVCGVMFVTLIGWRLLPLERLRGQADEETESTFYIAELRVEDVPEDEEQTLGDFYELAEELDLNLLGLGRHGKRLPGFARREVIRPGDYIVVEGDPKAIEGFMGKAKLGFAGSEKHEGSPAQGSLTLLEAIVPDDALIVGRSTIGLRLLGRYDVTLIGVARGGRRFRERVRKLEIRAGDVLLLLGTPERLASAVTYLGVLPIEGRRTGLLQRQKARLAIGLFMLSIIAAVAGLVSLPVALSGCVVAYVLFGLLRGHEVYEAVDWKVIVLLASLIPLSEAFAESGGAGLIATAVLDLTSSYPPWVVLLALMVITMTLSDFLNNVATALLAAPVGVEIARSLDLSPDPFLMGVAVAASSAFLTPIGHKNNTMIMGPGGYRFSDYFRMGLPLELIVLSVSVPALMFFWPLGG